MRCYWLVLLFFVFVATALFLFVFVDDDLERKDRTKWLKMQFARRIIGGICAFLGLTSICLLILALLLGKDSGIKEELNSDTELFYLAKAEMKGDDEYLSKLDGKFKFFYYDDSGEVQVGFAPAEVSKVSNGNLDGKACVIITITHYCYYKEWLCFTPGSYKKEETYEFYIP